MVIGVVPSAINQAAWFSDGMAQEWDTAPYEDLRRSPTIEKTGKKRP
jgi:hypothetical protein